MSSSTIFGAVAAAAAPLFMSIGFCLWDLFWRAHPFSLNLFKCTLAAAVFVCVAATVFQLQDRTASVYSDSGAAWFLVLSALIGITVGDNCWLVALRLIGARRVILVDAIKPFAAALLAWPVFGEEASYLTVIGMVVCMAGIVYVSMERAGAGAAAVSKSAAKEEAAAVATATAVAVAAVGAGAAAPATIATAAAGSTQPPRARHAANDAGDDAEGASGGGCAGCSAAAADCWRRANKALGRSPCSECSFVRRRAGGARRRQQQQQQQQQQPSPPLAHAADANAAASACVDGNCDDGDTSADAGGDGVVDATGAGSSRATAATVRAAPAKVTAVGTTEAASTQDGEREGHRARAPAPCQERGYAAGRGEGGGRHAEEEDDDDDDEGLDGETDVVQAVGNEEQEAEGRRRTRKSRQCGHGCTKQFAIGYAWATANVLLDVGGSALTKYFGAQMNTWEIGAIRFGSAAFTMLVALGVARVLLAGHCIRGRAGCVGVPVSSQSLHPDGGGVDCGGGSGGDDDGGAGRSGGSGGGDCPAALTAASGQARSAIVELHEMPAGDGGGIAGGSGATGVQTPDDLRVEGGDGGGDRNGNGGSGSGVGEGGGADEPRWYEWAYMTAPAYAWVILGIAVTTFACPSLQAYAIFEIDLATYSTLSAMTPIYSLPVVLVIKREATTWRAIVGSFVACLGIIPLALGLAAADAAANAAANVTNVTTLSTADSVSWASRPRRKVPEY